MEELHEQQAALGQMLLEHETVADIPGHMQAPTTFVHGGSWSAVKRNKQEVSQTFLC